jgi:hypothetical protein
LIAFGVVIERLRSGDELSVPVQDAGHVLALGDIDAAEKRGLLAISCG